MGRFLKFSFFLSLSKEKLFVELHSAATIGQLCEIQNSGTPYRAHKNPNYDNNMLDDLMAVQKACESVLVVENGIFQGCLHKVITPRGAKHYRLL